MQDAAELKTFLQSQKPMLLLVGTTDLRKTHLLSQFISFSDPAHMVFRLKGRSNLQLNTLITVLSKHWAIRQTKATDPSVTHQLDHLLHCLESENQTCLLIIEKAHLLSSSLLSKLCYLNQHKPTCIRMILIGHPELVSKMNVMTQGKNNSPNVIHLTERKQHTYHRYALSAVATCSFILCGFLWWKTQENRLLFLAHHSQSFQTEQKPSQSSHA